MNRTVFSIATLGVVLVVSAGELTVSPDGLSPEQALLKIRAAKQQGDMSAWTVRVKPGFYVLKDTLRLTPADSGSAAAPVSWLGEGEAVFSGGAPLRDWTVDANGVWSAPIPKDAAGKSVHFEELWANGRRADRARLPARGYLRLVRPSVTNATDTAGRFLERATLTNAAVCAALAKLTPEAREQAQACIVHKWSFARRILRNFDAATGTFETRSPVAWNRWQTWNEKETLVWFENVPAAFTEPGTWLYDAAAGRVRYRPLPGETPEKTQIIAPVSKLSRLVDVCGEPARGALVHDIRFRNIVFAYSDVTPTSGSAIRAEAPKARLGAFQKGGPTESWQHQAASASDGAITVEGGVRLSWTECAVRHTGNYAFRFYDGSQSNALVNCTLEELGAGGVTMGARRGAVAPGEKLTRRVIRTLAPTAVAFNAIENCAIRTGGRFNPEGTGVALTHASDCRVVHCEIRDLFYTGVSVGWTWGFAGSVAQRNEIAFNSISDLGKGVMSDMGGVYTLGTSYGTTVHDNVIHDVRSFSYGGWALYCDEGSEGIAMERNLCWNTTDGGFHQHYGTGCVIRNNIFAWNRIRGAVRMSRREVQQIPCTLHFVNNIVLVDGSPLAGKGVRGVGGVWANNVWWDVSKKPDLDGLDWTGWCASDKERGSVLTDPRFENAARFDFRLKADSPAFKLGFKAWDYVAAGRTRSRP